MKRTIKDFLFFLVLGLSFGILLTSCSRSTVFERNDTTYSIDAKVLHCWNAKQGYYKVKLESVEGMGILRSIACK